MEEECEMTGNLLAVGPVAVAQLLLDVLAGLGNKGEDRLIAFLPFVPRVVSLARAHLIAIEGVYGRVGVHGDGWQPYVCRFPHPLPQGALQAQPLLRHAQV